MPAYASRCGWIYGRPPSKAQSEGGCLRKPLSFNRGRARSCQIVPPRNARPARHSIQSTKGGVSAGLLRFAANCGQISSLELPLSLDVGPWIFCPRWSIRHSRNGLGSIKINIHQMIKNFSTCKTCMISMNHLQVARPWHRRCLNPARTREMRFPVTEPEQLYEENRSDY